MDGRCSSLSGLNFLLTTCGINLPASPPCLLWVSFWGKRPIFKERSLLVSGRVILAKNILIGFGVPLRFSFWCNLLQYMMLEVELRCRNVCFTCLCRKKNTTWKLCIFFGGFNHSCFNYNPSYHFIFGHLYGLKENSIYNNRRGPPCDGAGLEFRKASLFWCNLFKKVI